MTRLHDLSARLKALSKKSKFNRNNARILASGNPDENNNALLIEIYETILARHLEFQTDSGANMGLNVSGRRALCITSMKDAAGSDIDNPLIGVPLSEDEHQEAFIKIALAFAKDADELAVISSIPKQPFDTSAVGLQASRIYKHIQKVQEAAAVPVEKEGTPAVRIADNSQDVLGWIVVKGVDAGQTAGDPEAIAALKQIAEDSGDAVDTYLNQFTTAADQPVAVMAGVLAGTGKAMLCIRVDGQLLFALALADSSDSLLQAWNDEIVN